MQHFTLLSKQIGLYFTHLTTRNYVDKGLKFKYRHFNHILPVPWPGYAVHNFWCHGLGSGNGQRSRKSANCIVRFCEIFLCFFPFPCSLHCCAQSPVGYGNVQVCPEPGGWLDPDRQLEVDRLQVRVKKCTPPARLAPNHPIICPPFELSVLLHLASFFSTLGPTCTNDPVCLTHTRVWKALTPALLLLLLLLVKWKETSVIIKSDSLTLEKARPRLSTKRTFAPGREGGVEKTWTRSRPHT